MNPGNGIETSAKTDITIWNDEFPINESRQRDWNVFFPQEVKHAFLISY